MAGRRGSPAAASARLLENAPVARFVGQQFVAKVIGIFPRRRRKLIHEAFHRETVDRVADGAHVAEFRADFMTREAHRDIRDPIEVIRCRLEHRIKRVLDGGIVARRDRGRGGVKIPAVEPHLGIERGADADCRGRAERVMRHVIFARPDQLDGPSGGFRGQHRGGNEVDIQAPSECPAQQGREYPHFFRSEPDRARRGLLRELLRLRADMDVAAVCADIRRAVHGLHRCVRQHGQLVQGAHPAVRFFERANRIAIGARGKRGATLQRAAQRGADAGIVEPGIGTGVPADLERIARLQRLPVVIRDHDDAARTIQHLAHARHFLCRGRIECARRAAEGRTLRQRGVQHPRQLDIDAELRAAVDFRWCIEPREAASDQPEIPGLLEFHLFRQRQLRGGLGELAIGHRFAVRSGDRAISGVAVAWRHSPGLRCGAEQQDARLRTSRAQLHPRVRHAVAGAGDLAAIALVDVGIADRRGDDADRADPDLKLLGDQHRQRGVHALAHLGAIHQHRDRIVPGYPQPRIELAARRLARASRAAAGGERQGNDQAGAARSGPAEEFAAVECGGRGAHEAAPWARSSSAAR
jgi:hypothetical protein